MEELADLVAFLASDRASYVNGARIACRRRLHDQRQRARKRRLVRRPDLRGRLELEEAAAHGNDIHNRANRRHAHRPQAVPPVLLRRRRLGERAVGRHHRVDNPATGEVVGTVPKLGAAETRDAIEAADRALPAWRKKTAKERARRAATLVRPDARQHQEDLARLMTIEQGKPLAESKGEVVYAAAFLEWFGEEAKRVYGDTIPGHQADKRIVVIKQPIGVVACITPWNFPLAMITRKAGPAIAAGCTVVLKPASQTPFSALALAELAERAGIPKGVFNVVTGSAARDRRRADVESDREEAVVHRLDRGRQGADGAVRRRR